jgi:hypothetical protein
LLFCIDLSVTHRLLDSGELRCPRHGCDGRLGSWGSARRRTIRLSTATQAQYTPRRARCRTCKRTQVLASASTLPHRPDHASTVGTALLGALDGLGHRQVAERVGLPHTTVRGWLRRARLNAGPLWSRLIRWVSELDPTINPFNATTEPFAAMIDALGFAVAAWVRRFGQVDEPWKLIVTLTSGALLAPPHRLHQRRHPLDST